MLRNRLVPVPEHVEGPNTRSPKQREAQTGDALNDLQGQMGKALKTTRRVIQFYNGRILIFLNQTSLPWSCKAIYPSLGTFAQSGL